MLKCVNSKIKIIGVWSFNIKEIYDIYCKSLSSFSGNFEIELVKIDLSDFDKYGFGTDSWHKSALIKIDFIYNSLCKLKENEILVFNDVDIQYLNPINLIDVYNTMKSKNLDFFGVMEHNSFGYIKHYNGGFYLIKNTSKTREMMLLIREELKISRRKFADQDILNDIIKKSGLNHNFIPCEYYVNGPYAEINQKAVFHHATLAFKNCDKIKQLQDVYIKYFTEKHKYWGFNDYSKEENNDYFKNEYGGVNKKHGFDVFDFSDKIYLNNPFADRKLT